MFQSTNPGWIMAGTTGQTLFNLIGYESDELYRGTNLPGDPGPYPGHAPTVIVASSDFVAGRKTTGAGGACDPQNEKNCVPMFIGTAESTYYTMNTGAKVFAASGQQWSWGLDDWGADKSIGPPISGRIASRKEDARRITENIIACFSINTPIMCGQ